MKRKAKNVRADRVIYVFDPPDEDNNRNPVVYYSKEELLDSGINDDENIDIYQWIGRGHIASETTLIMDKGFEKRT